MPDFNIRSDSVNVEQIMERIRARIREKRGVDYTEEQIRELAAVKLEKFLDPRSVRSDLLKQVRGGLPAYQQPEPLNYSFDASTLFESHRAPIRWVRRLLRPLLKLFFNPNLLIQALHIQSRLNTIYSEHEQLYYELIHNLVIETTRLGIEVKNLKMRIESLTGRLEFNERRARALESVVVYRPSDEREEPAATPGEASLAQSKPQEMQPVTAEGPGQRSRRRRRRRGRRGGRSAAAVTGASSSTGPEQGTTGTAHAPSGDLRRIEQPLSDDDVAREAGETHAATAERVEQALASDTQRAEPQTPSPGSGPGRPDDQQ